ncbi:MAG: hypothetical protein M1816_002153 [Peltula sp. TS41687]|nr:MAG: hypothetical protein M1816_002153 [Peltula sp. TS41687]
MFVPLQRQRLGLGAIIVGGTFLFLLIVVWFRDALGLGSRGRPLQGSARQSLIDHVFNDTLGFQKIFVINLPYRTDHRDSMTLAAALNALKLDWIDGVSGADVPDKILPPGGSRDMGDGSIGAWRAILNAMRAVVEQNLTTALIFEDDVDWDIRIRSQLRDFAFATHALTQPLASNPSAYADPTYPYPNDKDGSLLPPDLSFDHLPATIPPSMSPFGDGWDLLWLGHCGQRFPNLRGDEEWASRSRGQAKGRVVRLNDPTVPEKKYLKVLSEPDDIAATYPPHTRVIHHPMDLRCSLAYGVTQSMARHVIYEMSVKKLSGPFDIMLREMCEGLNGRGHRVCIGPEPQLFNHHRPAGNTNSYSDITDHGHEIREKASTHMIRLSAKMNFEKLLRGEADFDDQWPDTR